MYHHDIMEHGNVFWVVAVITQISIASTLASNFLRLNLREPLLCYTNEARSDFWQFWVTVESKRCFDVMVMVEAVDNLQLLLTLILDIYQVF